MQIQSISPSFNSYKNNSSLNENNSRMYSTYSPSFSGRESKLFKPAKDLGDKLTTGMAKIIAPIISSKPGEKIVKLFKTDKLTSILLAFTSILLSSFYIKKTLSNEQLDETKRRTLAINQAGTCIFSTISAFTIEKVLDAKIRIFKNKFKAVNIQKEIPKEIDHLEKGVGAAASIMIFGTMYRFIAPVLITPIANAIGNRLNERDAKVKAAKAVKAQKQA